MQVVNEDSTKEKTQHGDIFLPINSYHCLIPETYTELALHWHEEMEITLIREGLSDYRVNPAAFRAAAGDLILVPPFCLHSACEIQGETMISDSLVFHLDLLGAKEQDMSASRYIRPLSSGQLLVTPVIHPQDAGYRELKEVFLSAMDCFLEKRPYYELWIKEYLLRLLILLFENGYIYENEADRTEQENQRHLKEVLQFIGEHYREHIRISQLAALSGYSESYFMNCFKEFVGMTCVRYINQYRIQMAAKDLEMTDLPVMEVALNNGFENVSYFNLQFRKQFGMTPRAFRMKVMLSNLQQ